MTTLTDFKQKQLARIHILKKEKGLDDDGYRAVLQQVGGVDSSKKLTALGRARVIKQLSEGKL
jgi:phage gp16-like protein